MRTFLCSVVLCSSAFAQTAVNGNRVFLGSVDMTGATVTKPFRQVTTEVSGPCSNAAEVVQNINTGHKFSCIGGVWVQDATGGTAGGTVTSVALSMPTTFSVSGSPIATSGQFTVSWQTQAPNTFFAGPASGGNATPVFRTLAPVDIPALSYENPLTFNAPLTRASNAIGCTTCVVTSGTYADPGWLTQLAYSKLTGAPSIWNQLVGTNSSSQTPRNRINLIQGSNVTIAAADNAGTNSTDITISATGGGGGGNAYATFQNNGNPLTERSTANFTSEFSVTDNAGAGRTDIAVNAIAGTKVSGNITGNAANVTGVIALASGGTGQTTKAAAFDALQPMSALGQVIYGGTGGASTVLNGNTTTTRRFLRQTGDGTNSAAPAWDTLAAGDIPDISATYQSKIAYTTENVDNKTTATDLGAGSPSDTLYPSQKAVKTYVDAHAAGGGATLPTTPNVIKGDNAGGAEVANPGVDYYKPGTQIASSDLPSNVVKYDAATVFSDPGNQYYGAFDRACDATGITPGNDGVLVKKGTDRKCVLVGTTDTASTVGVWGLLVSGSGTVNGKVRVAGVGSCKGTGTINEGYYIVPSGTTSGYCAGSASRPAGGNVIIGRANASLSTTVPVDLNIDINPSVTGLGYTAENVANKSTDTGLGSGSPSDSLYPSQKAVKTYVDAHAAGGSSTPVHAVAYVSTGAGFILPGSGAWPTTTAQALSWDTNGDITDAAMHSTSVNSSRVIATVSGWYHGQCQITAADNAMVGTLVIALMKNGTTPVAVWTGSEGGWDTRTAAGEFQMAQNDYVECQVKQSTGAARDAQGGSASATFIAITKISE